MKKTSTWIVRILLVLGLLSFLYRPWQEVLPVELVLLYFWLTSAECALKCLGRSVFLVELAYLFILPLLIWHYFLQNNAFWVLALPIMWLQILGRLWRMYRESDSLHF